MTYFRRFFWKIDGVLGELTSELEAKSKTKTRSVLNLNSQVRSMGAPLKVFFG